MFRKVGLLKRLSGAWLNPWKPLGFALDHAVKVMHFFQSARDFKLFSADPARHADRITGSIQLDNATVSLAWYIDNPPNCICLRCPSSGTQYVFQSLHQSIRAFVTILHACPGVY
jgi:predicted nuclease of predicted toxin-antitoxin system